MTEQSDTGAAGAQRVDYEAFARVSTNVSLSHLRFNQFSAETYRDASVVKDGWQDRCFVGYRVGAPQAMAESVTVLTSFLAVYHPNSDLKDGDLPPFDEEDPPAVVVEAQVEMTYLRKIDSELAQEDLAAFANANGVLHAWPYWREFVQNSTARLGVPPLVIGTFKLPSPPDPGVASDE